MATETKAQKHEPDKKAESSGQDQSRDNYCNYHRAGHSDVLRDDRATGRYSVGENPVGEKSGVGEKPPLVKIPNPEESKGKDFSPTQFSPTQDRRFSPTTKREFSPTKKPKLKLINPAKNGQPGRPRNPDLPPSPGKYFYWGKARNGLKLERRKPEYEYIGFIMPNEWEHLRGTYDEQYILKVIIAAIRVKRARSTQDRRHSAGVA